MSKFKTPSGFQIGPVESARLLEIQAELDEQALEEKRTLEKLKQVRGRITELHTEERTLIRGADPTGTLFEGAVTEEKPAKPAKAATEEPSFVGTPAVQYMPDFKPKKRPKVDSAGDMMIRLGLFPNGPIRAFVSALATWVKNATAAGEFDATLDKLWALAIWNINQGMIRASRQTIAEMLELLGEPTAGELLELTWSEEMQAFGEFEQLVSLLEGALGEPVGEQAA